MNEARVMLESYRVGAWVELGNVDTVIYLTAYDYFRNIIKMKQVYTLLISIKEAAKCHPLALAF